MSMMMMGSSDNDELLAHLVVAEEQTRDTAAGAVEVAAAGGYVADGGASAAEGTTTRTPRDRGDELLDGSDATTLRTTDVCNKRRLGHDDDDVPSSILGGEYGDDDDRNQNLDKLNAFLEFDTDHFCWQIPAFLKEEYDDNARISVRCCHTASDRRDFLHHATSNDLYVLTNLRTEHELSPMLLGPTHDHVRPQRPFRCREPRPLSFSTAVPARLPTAEPDATRRYDGQLFL
ncbi:hypothetical protein QE152_g33456 [Popillia japonica]|uniref:Uncharacterized protein n=1 Tax=Popillia japonica TaxID=7064 RepID=A0AAW1IWP9_POPJA